MKKNLFILFALTLISFTLYAQEDEQENNDEEVVNVPVKTQEKLTSYSNNFLLNFTIEFDVIPIHEEEDHLGRIQLAIYSPREEELYDLGGVPGNVVGHTDSDGKGELEPMEGNSTPMGKSKNRRVEF